jgi:hypothetical protein
MKFKQLLFYVAIYEIAAFLVNKQAGRQVAPLDLLSQMLPAAKMGQLPSDDRIGSFDQGTGKYNVWKAGTDRMFRSM